MTLGSKTVSGFRFSFSEKRTTITGGKGFLGKHLIRKLEEGGCRNVRVADLPDYDLTRLTDIQRLYNEQKPDIVIHLAAKVGASALSRRTRQLSSTII